MKKLTITLSALLVSAPMIMQAVVTQDQSGQQPAPTSMTAMPPMIISNTSAPVALKDADNDICGGYQRLGSTPEGYNYGMITMLVVENGNGTPATTGVTGVKPTLMGYIDNSTYQAGGAARMGAPAQQMSLYEYIAPTTFINTLQINLGSYLQNMILPKASIKRIQNYIPLATTTGVHTDNTSGNNNGSSNT